MSLTDYLRIIIRRGWIIVLAMVLTAAAAYIFSKLQTPTYRATQKILLQPARNDFGLQQVMRQLMGSYVARLDTDERAREVIDLLNLDMTPGSLHGMVSVNPDLNNLVINIDVDVPGDESAASLAAQVARAYGEQFVQWRNQQNDPLRLEDRINAELLDYPQPGLFRPDTKINVIAGALLGLILGGIVIFILEYIDSNIVRRSQDIERYIQLPVLGNLPELQ